MASPTTVIGDTPTVVVDSSTVVVALTDSGSIGRWAEDVLSVQALVAPHIMPAEVSDILRRSSLAGDLPDELAELLDAPLATLDHPAAGTSPVEPFQRPRSLHMFSTCSIV